MWPSTKTFNFLKHCSGCLILFIYSKPLSGSPLPKKERPHFCTCHSRTLCEKSLPVPHTTLTFYSRADICEFSLSGILPFFSFSTWISPSGNHPPTHTYSPMCTALIESRVPLSTETIGNSSSLSLTQCSQSGYMARVLKQGSTLKQLTTWGRLGSYLGIKVCFCCWHPRTRAEALPSLFHTTSRYKPAILPREAY